MAVATADRNGALVPTPDADFNVADMALYGLKRARCRLDALDSKPEWDLADTACFDCMHYLGDTALHTAAQALDLKPGSHVVDIGAGFSATGRFLHKNYGVNVTGVELQPEIHDIAQTITARNGMAAQVRSINADFTTLTITEPVGHIVSFLCILHIPDRANVFGKAACLLQDGGTIYIEDFFARETLSETTARQLRDIVSCPYLPSREQYVADLEAAGFTDVQFTEMTGEWADFVHARAVEYGQFAGHEASLLTFYSTIDSLFGSGQLGGARIMAKKI
ncbi:hypothetical protein NQ176_g2931 [Zarea fungicola]|uniref:Uncharacterized protein n=1 Tax=Zarea fungicola TaxID=93591 RepID=A0ACC1NM21_9HYPO|nr:hypothetical protein NQ176_g2931 [Lecanicillium fungicola]